MRCSRRKATRFISLSQRRLGEAGKAVEVIECGGDYNTERRLVGVCTEGERRLARASETQREM